MLANSNQTVCFLTAAKWELRRSRCMKAYSFCHSRDHGLFHGDTSHLCSELAIAAIAARPNSPQWLVDEVAKTRAGLLRLRQNVVLLRNADEPDSFFPVHPAICPVLRFRSWGLDEDPPPASGIRCQTQRQDSGVRSRFPASLCDTCLMRGFW